LEVKEIISSGLLEKFVMEETSEQETLQILQWKKLYPEVAAEIEAIEISLEQYALTNAIKPSDTLKGNIFAAIKKENTAPKLTSDPLQKDHTNVEARTIPIYKEYLAPTSLKWKYGVAAAATLLIGSVIGNAILFNKYTSANNNLASAEKELLIQNEKGAILKNNMDAVLASNTIVLKGTPKAPTTTAKIFWIKNTQNVYVEANGLPEAPSGMQYQLWAIVDGKPVDGGMILKNKSGEKYSIQKMKSFGKAEAFAITLEKEGGSPTPTMDNMFVMSTT
jgi:hypothetical protein